VAALPLPLLFWYIVAPVVLVGYVLYGDVHAQVVPPWPTPPPLIDVRRPPSDVGVLAVLVDANGSIVPTTLCARDVPWCMHVCGGQ
jgi:hypothetical protein